MGQQGNDRARLITETANRLRLAQLDLADEDTNMRHGCLGDEIEKALASVPAEERQDFLAKLLQRFPTWDSQVEVAQPQDQAVPHSGVDEKELTDASFLVSRLEAVAPSLSEPQRQVVRDRLAAAGLAPKGGAWPSKAAEAVAAQLGVSAEAELDPARLLELMSILAKQAIYINKVAWPIWREVAPRSKLRGASDLRKSLAKFAAPERDARVAPAAQDLDRLVHVVAALLGGLRGSGRNYAQGIVDRVSVPVIEAMVDIEATGFGKLGAGREVRCWRKMKDVLQKHLNVETIEREILEAVADSAEGLLSGQRVK